MNDIERELIELQSHLATFAMEREMLEKKMRDHRAEVHEAVMNFENALRRLEDVKLMEEAEDADSER